MLILGQVVVLAVLGVSFGVPAVLLVVAPAVESLLFGVSAHDAFLVSAAAERLLCVAGLAGTLPARKAARLHPLVALRAE